MVSSTRRPHERTDAAPFLKWAGGKSQLLASILPRLPTKIRTYYEPFIGGGAVFFSLARELRFSNAVLADRNPSLVEAYRTVRDDVEALVDALASHARHATSPEYFYELRGMDGATWSSVERTARLLYLNKTCFNGLYRVNRQGQFNVPFGKYAHPRPRRQSPARLFVGASVSDPQRGLRGTCGNVRRGDAVYFDPYVQCRRHVVHRVRFIALRGRRPRAPRSDVSSMLCAARLRASNSDCAFTRTLYRDLDVTTVHATRSINSVASRRGSITEVLVVGLAKNGNRVDRRSTSRRQRKAA